MSPEYQQDYRHGRTDLTGEHAFGDAGQVAVLILFLAVYVLDSFVLKYTAFLIDKIPLAVQITLGVVFMLVAGYLAGAGMKIVFGEVREKPAVINKGPFRFVRHPIYLSEILFYFGLLWFRASLAAFIIWIFAIIFFVYISRHEEKLLLARFGDDYKEYMQKVGMFIPKIWKLKKQL
jgi:protein-S-isoprenylcysteine O-methyltransferase Ste14